MNCCLLPVRFVQAAGILLAASFTSPVSAQSLTNLAGTWNNIMFSSPSRLTLQRDWVQNPGGGGAYVLREIEEKNFFEMGTGQIVAQTDGTFTGMASGTFSLASGGRMVVSGAGFAPVTFQMNAAGDFMFAMKGSGDGFNIQDLELLLKAPATMTGAEMAGTWKSVSLATPSQLVLQRETMFNTYATNVVGRDQFDVNAGSVAIAADGTLVVSGNDGPMSGTYGVGTSGAVDVTITNGMTFHFYVNSSKNVMATLNQNFPERNELILLVKQPASSAPADFKGLWRAGSYVTPATLTLIHTNYGLVTDIVERNNFEFSIGAVNMGHNGAFTSPSEPAFGQATLLGTGTVQTVATNTSGEVNADTFWVNAAKDVLVTVVNDGGHRFTLATRAPAESVPSESMGMMRVGPTIYWASDTNRLLQVSTNLNDWTGLPSTLGQSSYSMNPAAASKGFFRVMATP